MSEEVEKAMRTATGLMEEWQERRDYTLARNLEFALSMLKLMIGGERFDECPTFARCLKEASRVVDDYEKGQEAAS